MATGPQGAEGAEGRHARAGFEEPLMGVRCNHAVLGEEFAQWGRFDGAPEGDAIERDGAGFGAAGGADFGAAEEARGEGDVGDKEEERDEEEAFYGPHGGAPFCVVVS